MPKAINVDLDAPVVASTPSATQTEPKPQIVKPSEVLEETYGLTTEEILDVNAIKVTISDPCPIVILFGAKTSGKTMTLVRLTRFLRSQGYRVEPDRVFRSANSSAYQEMCDKFDETITNDNAAGGTSVIGFMLVTIRDNNGNPICQILEAPGEHYFDEDNRTSPFPRYINEILAMKNRRTWVFIVERNWKDSSVRNAYAEKIISMQDIIPSSDKVIFTCHKADLSRGLFKNGRPIVKQFFNDIKNQYPGIFARYTNSNPITSLWKPYNFEFVAFSSGVFNKLQDGGQSYTPSQDFYPAGLWEKIRKAVMGSWF
ncbi:MAG: hypothetical protein K2J62_04440 [Bacteroidales bacterium]|nr:hypothetical protein [Bacteroidales bacterium]